MNRAVFDISITLAGRAADPHRPNPCRDVLNLTVGDGFQVLGKDVVEVRENIFRPKKS